MLDQESRNLALAEVTHFSSKADHNKNESLFFQCCRTRYQYEMSGASALQWQEFAEKFQDAKGSRHSYMAEYCRVRAGRVQ